MNPKIKIILGPPGTGKTTALIKILEELLKKTNPQKIAFVSFTRKAAYQARDKVKEKFNLSNHQLLYFRTLHSLCFREIGFTVIDMFQRKHYAEISKLIGWKFTGFINPEGPDAHTSKADQYLYLTQVARNRVLPLKRVWEEMGEDTPWKEVKYFSETYNQFKKVNCIFDFTDQLEVYLKAFDPLNIDYAIIDEAQDLSFLQWQVINKIFYNAKEIYIAGDDDQAIYKWSGAAVEYFLSLRGEVKFLKKSFRIPKKIFNLSQSLVKRIENRHKKIFEPKKAIGKIQYHYNIESLPILESEGSWYFLGRNRYLLNKYEELLKSIGLKYSIKDKSSVKKEHAEAIYGWTDLTRGKEISEEKQLKVLKFISRYNDKLLNVDWHNTLDLIPNYDREYYRSILRRNGHLLKETDYHLNTIHGVKGGEADNVCILSDVSYRTFKAAQKDMDSETRVFFVGITRAKKNLHIILPETNLFYEMI